MARQVLASLRGKRFLAAAALSLLAPVLAGCFRSADPAVLVRIVGLLVLFLQLPLAAISLGSGLVYDEAEEGTLTYLFTAPVSREAVVLGKWAAALACGWGLLAASLGATFLLSASEAGTSGPFAEATWTAVLLGFPAYLGVFTLLGVLFRQGFLACLAYSFAFEFVLGLVPGAAKRVSLGFYLRSLVAPHSPEPRFFEGTFQGLPPDPPTTCTAVLAGVALVSLALSLLVVHGKEFRARSVQG
jgi:ABC-2 type transport system permease protein